MDTDCKNAIGVITAIVVGILAIAWVVFTIAWRYDKAMIDNGFVKVPTVCEHWEKAK